MTARRPARSVLLAIFMASGVSGLIYESIWSHYLKLFLGHAAYAQTLVLAIFMGGMSLGSWLIARYSRRIRSLLIGYAIVELLIGCLALLFHRGFVASTSWAFDSLLPQLHEPSAILAAKWTLAAALIVPQSILLGMTFPLMSGAVVRSDPRRSGETLAMLYFTNSLGAACGVLLSGFLLIGLLGLPGTVLAAGVLNVAIAAVVWLLWKRQGESDGGEPGQADASGATPSVLRRWILLGAAVTGAAAFLYEIAWIRMLSLVLGSSTHSFELMLSAFILGIALGGLWVHRRIDTLAQPLNFLGRVLLAMSLVALASLALYEPSFDAMSIALRMFTPTDAGYAGFHLVSHGIALVLMIPTTFFCGMTLPVMTQILLRAGDGEKAIGAVYSWNTVGSIMGVVAAVHLLMPWIGVKGLVVAGASLHALAGIGYLCADAAPAARLRAAWRPAAAALTAVIAAITFVRFDPLRLTSGVYRHGRVTALPGSRVLYFRHGKTASISLIANQGYVGIATNGKPDATIAMQSANAAPDEITMTLAGALPLALHPRPARVANIGIGSGLTSQVLLNDPRVQVLDTIEIEPLMAEAAKLGFMPRVRSTFEDPRSHIHFDDAKTFFATHPARYDVIVSEPSNPWVSGVATLFSDEFYAQLTRYLAPDGMLLQWVQVYETDVHIISSIIRALAPHFADFAIYHADDGNIIIVAVRSGKVGVPGGWIFANAATNAELQRVGLLNLRDVQARYIAGSDYMLPLALSDGAPANSDYFPFVDLNAIRARITQRTAVELPLLTALPVPLMDLLHNTLPLHTSTVASAGLSASRDLAVQQAVLLRDAMLTGGYAGLTAAGTRMLRSLTRNDDDCQLAPLRSAWLDAVFFIASGTATSLSLSELDAIWSKLQASPCLALLQPEERNWFELMHATARRDSAAVLTQGLQTLQSKLVFPAREQFLYALTATSAAAIAQQQPRLALQLIDRYRVDASAPSSYALALRMIEAGAAAQSATAP